MKTKLQYIKESFVLSLIWNIYYPILIVMPFSHIVDMLYLIAGGIVVWLIFTMNSIEKWYVEYKFEEIEKEIKSLKEKQNNNLPK